MNRVLPIAALLAFSLAPLTARAELPEWLRTENRRVRDGNEKLTKGDAKSALESYTLAARELPESPGVQLDRGLALLKSGDLTKARESFVAATAPNAAPALRADAYQNLGLAFYREGDQLAGQNKHKEAQQMFRESVDAGKRSLRLRPGDPNTAWNLELATRRIREEEQKQKEEDEKNKQENKDKDQDKDQNQDQDKQQGDDQKNDSQDSDQQKDPQADKDKAKQDDAEKKQQDQQQAKQDPKQQQQQPKDGQDGSKSEPEEAQSPQLPAEAEQALDALGDSEENFERYRARQRASRERRAPEKDW